MPLNYTKLKLAFFIALRFLSFRINRSFITFISYISIIGITIGILALIVVMSVMNGFHVELKNKILNVISDVQVINYNKININNKIISELENDFRVSGVTTFSDSQGMMLSNKIAQGVVIKGIDHVREKTVSNLASNVIDGSINFLIKDFSILIGESLANKMDLNLGDDVIILFPDGRVSITGFLPIMKRFEVVGIFNMGMTEYDSSLIYTSENSIRKIFKNKKKFDEGLKIKLKNIDDAIVFSKNMQEKFPELYFVNWTETHKNFFRAIQIEKRVMMIILFMIVSVAIFNIISTLVMIVNEKKSEIALLRAFGASKGFIVSIFVLLGTIIGFIGTFVGVILGLTVALNLSEIVLFIESIFGSNLFTSEVYFLNDLPSSIDSSEIIFISIFAFILTIFATIYPAFKATQSHPAKVLRADI